jgi:hypothetical protein
MGLIGLLSRKHQRRSPISALLREKVLGTTGRCGALLSVLSLVSCDGSVRPEPLDYEILGYSVSGSANGTDATTGENLSCGFSILDVDTGGPFVGSWTDTATIHVIRNRSTPTITISHDTTIAAQEVTVTVSDSFHIRVAVNGPFTADLRGDMIPAYPGYGVGTWTCDTHSPRHSPMPCFQGSGILSQSLTFSNELTGYVRVARPLSLASGALQMPPSK